MTTTCSWRTWLAFALFSILSVAGCTCGEDTGRCCVALDEETKMFIPMAEETPGMTPMDIIRSDPKFDCSELTCVSYQGSEAFCTRLCDEEDACPEGFECTTVLNSAYCDFDNSTPDTDDDCGPGDILPTDTFCVRQRCGEGFSACPDDFACVTVHEGSGTAENPIIQHCVLEEHMCSTVEG